MPQGYYSMVTIPDPAAEPVHVMPMFYGLLAFATAGARAGGQLRAVRTLHSSNAFIKAWAATDSAGVTRVVLIHKDPAASANATIAIAPPQPLHGVASLALGLPGPKGMASAWDGGLSFAGMTWGAREDGTSTPAPGVAASYAVPADASGGFSFELPPASFAILTLPAE